MPNLVKSENFWINFYLHRTGRQYKLQKISVHEFRKNYMLAINSDELELRSEVILNLTKFICATNILTNQICAQILILRTIKGD